MSPEADGLISIYDIETGNVLASYEGLEVHNLVQACLELHSHPKMQQILLSEPGHIIVDEDAYQKMVNAISALTGRFPHAVAHVKPSESWSVVNRARIRSAF